MTRSGRRTGVAAAEVWPEISEAGLAALKQGGFVRPTALQSALVTAVLEGKDVVLRGPSGTGRTLGMALAVAERIRMLSCLAESERGPCAVIFAFTSEDVERLALLLDRMGAGDFGVAVAHSGIRTERAAAALRKGPAVVVGTPSRIAALAERGSLLLGGLRLMGVLEADLLAPLGLLGEASSVLERAAQQQATDRVGAEEETSNGVQIVVVAAGEFSAPPGALAERLTAATAIEKPDIASGLRLLAPCHREIAEDEKLDLLVKLVGAAGGGEDEVLVIVRTEEEARDVENWLSRRLESPEATSRVLVDDGESYARELTSSREGKALVVGLHLPLDPVSLQSAPLDATRAQVLVNCEEYWDLVRTGVFRIGTKKERAPLTEAERMQRRYVRRDAARKIERLGPEEAGKEVARLLSESLAEAAFQQAHAPLEPSALESSAAGAREVAELLRRRDVEERLRDAQRGLAEAPCGLELGPEAALTEEEERSVLWAQEVSRSVLRMFADWPSRRSRDLDLLVEFLLSEYEASELVGALLAALVPSAPSAPQGATAGESECGDRGAMTRLFVSAGRMSRMTREGIERLLVEVAGLSPEDIGRIDVLARYTFVEVSSELAEQVVDRLAGVEFKGRLLTVARAKPPRNGDV